MKTAVMYGASKIGRGFIGALLAESGYEVVFVDVVPELVAYLNEHGRYAIRYVDGDHSERVVTGIRAVDGKDTSAVAEEIARAEVLATAVRPENLRRIAPNLAAGIRLRCERGAPPLNILICENLMDASRHLRALLAEHLTPPELDSVGLVETSIGRMVPDQNDPYVIRTESYCHLPVDADAFKGGIPPIAHMEPFSPFHFCVEQKLYIHNMAHAICAYLGMRKGATYIHEALAHEHIRATALGALRESALALAKKYNQPYEPLAAYAEQLIARFSNPELMDTCARVGADIPRKLAHDDRLVGAALNVASQGAEPVHICVGIAAALLRYLQENALPQEQAAQELERLSGLPAGHPIAQMALAACERL